MRAVRGKSDGRSSALTEGSKQIGSAYFRISSKKMGNSLASLGLCLALVKTSNGPTKSKAFMPAWSVNNTLIIGMDSVAAMIAVEGVP